MPTNSKAMTIEQQVPSLELCKRLKELGYPQNSLFYWVIEELHQEFAIVVYRCGCEKGLITSKSYSAPTVAELGEMLPPKQPNFPIKFDKWRTIMGNFEVISADTEADARAKVMIYLLENKLINL